MEKAIKTFIKEKIENRQNIYLIEPAQIDTDYNRETADWQAYHGRELLELIQNADDEANDTCPKKVRISFLDGILSVSNYGEPFSEDGIISLMYSNRSPKRERLKESIGSKGTGFRSILSWADTITIHSGDLHIRFSNEYSQKMLRNTFAGKYELSSKTKAATLAFPEWIEDDINDDFTTTILLKVKNNDEIIQDIQEQIDSIDENVLLFLRRTEELEFCIPNKTVIFRKIYDGNNVILSKEVNGEIECENVWTTISKSGSVIDDSDDQSEKNYTIIIAYSNDELIEKNQHIYSFFRTDVDFPYPFLLHANFELDQNRNHLNKSKINDIILSSCAELLVEAATLVAKKDKSDYDIVRLLISQRSLPEDLKKFCFDQKVLNAIRNATILPNVNGNYIKYIENRTVYYTNGLAKYISGKDFENCLQHIDRSEYSLIKLIKALYGVKYTNRYSYTFICTCLSKWIVKQKVNSGNNEANKLKIRNIVKTAISFFDEYESSIKGNLSICPGFFINEDGEQISGDANIFVTDENIETTKLPSFIDIEFMHPYMKDYLFKYLKSSNNSTFDTVEELSKFNIKVFNLEEIINHLKLSFDELKGNKTAKWKKLVQWLWDNQNLIKSSGVKLSFPLLTQNGTYELSDKLYYGSEYGNDLCDELFAEHPEKLICDLLQYINIKNINNLQTQMIEFVCLLNVAQLPRIVFVEESLDNTQFNREFFSRVFEDLSFPYKIAGKARTYDFPSLRNLLIRLTKVEFKHSSINELEQILVECSTGTILKWIQSDSRLKEMLFSKKDVAKSQISIKWDAVVYPVPIKEFASIYSYIYYKFSTIPWIEVNGCKYTIDHCLLDVNSNCSLEPILAYPNITDYIKDIVGNPKKLKREYSALLQNLSVKSGFSDGGFPELPLDTIYSVLMQLPKIENSGDLASDIYESLVTSSNPQLNQTCSKKEEFLKNGKVFCGDGYYPVSECRYLAEKNVSKHILNQYNIICIPSRRSAEKIEKILGVSKLNAHEELFDEPIVNKCNSAFNTEYRKFLPYAFAYRLDEIKSEIDAKDEARKISNVNITLCSEIKALYNDSVFNLNDYEYIISKNHFAYLKVPDAFSSEDLHHNNFLSAAVASILCSDLDIISPLKNFRELFYLGNNNEREQQIADDIGKPTIIEKSKTLLNFSEDLVEEYTRIVTALVEDKDINNIGLDELDFDDFAGINNQKRIISVFKKLGIDVADYNAESPSIAINLIPYYESEIERILILPSLEEAYKVALYKRLKDKPIGDKEEFVDCLLDYRNTKVVIENSVNFDVEKAVCEKLGIVNKAEDLELNKIYNKNQRKWKNSISSGNEFVDDFISYTSNVSLLYFNEIDELNKRFYEYVASHVVTPPVEEAEEKIIHEITDITFAHHASTNTPKESKKHTGFIKKENVAEQERTGKCGENIVYDYLKNSGLYSKINWVSENAKKAGINPEGRAGLGYDFEVFANEDERILIEVKASKLPISDGIHFKMSENEFQMANNSNSAFLIYYVGNAYSSAPELLIIKDLFSNTKETNYQIQCKKEYTITASVDGYSFSIANT